MTYNVFGGTLNLTQSVNLSFGFLVRGVRKHIHSSYDVYCGITDWCCPSLYTSRWRFSY